MPATITLRDETASGTRIGERTLDFLTDDITVRELITRRVQEEVREYNRRAEKSRPGRNRCWTITWSRCGSPRGSRAAT